MDFSLESQGSGTFLTYRIGEDEQVDEIALGMLANNKIPGLATAAYSQIEGRPVVKYNVSSRIPAKRLMTGVVNKNVLLGIFKGVCRAFSIVEEYMIPENTLVLDLEYIYVDGLTCDALLICRPVLLEDDEYDLRSFFRSVMSSIVFNRNEDLTYVTDIMNYLNGSSDFVIERFEAILNNAGRTGGQGRKTVPVTAKAEHVTYTGTGDKEAQPEVPQPPKVKKKKKTAEPVKTAEPPETVEEPPRHGPGAVIVEPIPNTHRQKDYVFDGMLIPGQKDDAGPVAPDPEPGPVEPDADSSQKMSVLYLLRHFDSETMAAYKAQQAEQKRKKQAAKDDTKSLKNQKNPKNPKDVQPWTDVARDIPENDWRGGETTVENPPGRREEIRPDDVTRGTSDRGASQPDIPAVLIRGTTGERIEIRSTPFRIGRSKADSDYCIADNKKVGRRHAVITYRDGGYFVIDQESLNHTFVNGEAIPSKVEYGLNQGDEIRFASEKFQFSLY